MSELRQAKVVRSVEVAALQNKQLQLTCSNFSQRALRIVHACLIASHFEAYKTSLGVQFYNEEIVLQSAQAL